MKLLLLQGLPASGKTTLAKKLVAENPGQWKRVNKDDLRAMLDVSAWSKANEKFVLKMRDYAITQALSQGYNVVVDDTNLDPRHEYDIRQMLLLDSSPDVRATIVETQFLDVPVNVCIERDNQRTVGHVGEQVIRKFASQLQGGKPRANMRTIVTPQPYVYQEGLPDCIMVDVDGTLAHMTTRLRFGDQAPFAWKYVGEDAVDEKLPQFVSLLDGTNKIIILSGRDSVCRNETEQWLNDNNIRFDELFMRAQKDSRNDALVKYELFDNHIRGRYNVTVVFDDRDRVCKMWRAIGLTCYQVAPGDF